MKTAHIFLLCVLGATLLSTVLCNNGAGPDDCCFKYYPRIMRKTLFRSYYTTDYRCAKPAVILVTKEKGRHICVDPSVPWVDNILRYLDEMYLE